MEALNMKVMEVCARLRARLTREGGIENIEWIALAAVILVMLGVIGGILRGRAPGLGNQIADMIQSWIARWAPSF